MRPVGWAVGVLAVVVGLWWLIRWGQYRGSFEWVPDWLFPVSGLSAPVSTLLASGGVIIAAFIAFWNGEKNRREERDKWVESKQQETVRSLRDRYFKITELLSGDSNYAQREAAVYSLVALSDDWASFYGDDTEAAVREQQTCLNVIVGQLRDPLPEKDDHDKDDHEKSRKRSELIVFKQRVQGVITQRYRPPKQCYESPVTDTGVSIPFQQGEWSHLDLDLSFCHLYKLDFSECVFDAKTLFNFAGFTGDTHFLGATFIGDTDFRDATFTGGTYFLGATFTGRTFFEGATFTGGTYFQDATFTGDTYFSGATFIGDTDFRDATFTGATYFSGATFTGDTDFSAARFIDNATFREREDQLSDRQTHEDRGTTNTPLRGMIILIIMVSFDGPSQFTQVPKFHRTEFLKYPVLTDDCDPRDFFAGAIFLNEQNVKE